MKNHVRFLLALGQLAAVGHSLNTTATSDLECFTVDAVDEKTLAFNTQLACAYECADADKPVFAVRGSGCSCLDSLPSDDKKVDPSECDELCPGYMLYNCGGTRRGYYSVGTVDAILAEPSNSTNTTSTASATASATTLPSSSSVPSNSSVTPTSSSASSSPTVDSTNAAVTGFGTSFTAVTSLVCAVAVLAALI